MQKMKYFEFFDEDGELIEEVGFEDDGEGSANEAAFWYAKDIDAFDYY